MLCWRFRRLTVTASFWFFTVVALFLLLGRGVFFTYLVIPVLLHEAGHLAVLFLLRGRVTAVHFQAFGIDIVTLTRPGMSYGGEILLAAAGILANLLAAGGLYLFAFQSMRTMFLIAANIAVALFNLMPIGNLDGGTILRLAGERLGGLSFGYTLSKAASLLMLAPLFGCAIFLLMQESPNVTLLVACLYLAGIVIRSG